MNKRALRRHHTNRLKRNRTNYNTVKNFYTSLDKECEHVKLRISKAVSTPKQCSCWMCGNPRRHMNEKTMQERKFDLENLIDYE